MEHDLNPNASGLKLKQTASALALVCITGGAQGVSISDVPLFLPTLVAPNIVVTLDDSTSMAQAFAPELCGATWDGGTTTECTCQSHASNYGAASSYSINTDGDTGGSTWESVAWCDVNHIGENILHSRRYKSYTFNPIYYNPNTTYALPVDSAGNPLTAPTFTAAYYNGFDPSQGTINLSADYRPSLMVWQYDNFSTLYNGHQVVDHPSADFSPVNTGAPAYYYVYDATIAGCSPQTSATVNNDNCYTRVNVSSNSGPGSSDERQNFANWYSFYRTRNLLTIAGATRAFSNLDPTTRVAWQALNSCNTFGSSCSGSQAPAINLDNRINVFAGAHKSNFYTWLTRLPTGSRGYYATPLRGGIRKAGQYFETSGDGSPYDNDFSAAGSGEYTCRPNFHILMTDGVWNDGSLPNSEDSNANVSLYNTIGNYDGTSQTLPDGKAYNPSGSNQPYEDTNSSSLADVAYYYWAKDLRTSLTNNQLPYYADRTGDSDAQYWNAKNDLANWQHMVNFTVGLGLGSFLTTPTWGGSTYAGDFSSFESGSSTWPATGADVVPGNVYDLWHAALNSRGQFFSADNPQALTDALLDTLNRITERQSSASALATNSTKLNVGTVVFQARFDSTDWSGQMIAYPVQSGGSLGNSLWDAGDPSQALIPAHGSRNILSWSGTAGITFNWASLSASQKNLIDSASAAAGSSPVLDYLRGDNSNEVRKGGSYRNRCTSPCDANFPTNPLLGDIINSDPFFLGAQNFGYSVLPESVTAPYQDFVNANNALDKMLYVGANDGMLHGFNVTTGGHEVFAYVPNAVMGNLSLLKDPAYTHKYFVDGSPFVGDAYFPSLSAWKSVLLGTTGAGGKAVFALDLTARTTMTAANVLWEFTHTELGNTIGQPVIARLHNSRWAAVFGNGYNSTSGTAKLFIVFLDADPSDGWQVGSANDYMVIDTDTAITTNGLSTVSLYDSNGDKIVDAAYAGDLQGNVWKFDLSSNNPSQWESDYKSGSTPVPLFRACGNNSGSCVPQPITAPIELGAPPTGQSGVMVYFGTGRFFATGDNIDLSVQSLYGILDSGTRLTGSLRSDLQEQTILFQGTDPGRADDLSTTNVNEFRAASTQSLRVVSANTVDYAGTERGWYLDLIPPSGAAAGERIVSIPLLRFGRVIFTTMIPSADPCAFGGTSWVMELDATTGGRLTYSVFDLDNDSQFDATDYVTITIAGQPVSVPVSAVQSDVGIIKTPTVITAGAVEYKLASGTTGNVSSLKEKGGDLVTGRVSWRELIND